MAILILAQAAISASALLREESYILGKIVIFRRLYGIPIATGDNGITSDYRSF